MSEPENAEDTNSEEFDEESAHSISPLVWAGIAACFIALAFVLNLMYEASVGLRFARLHQEISQIITSPEQLDTLLRSQRFDELIDPSKASSENAVAVLRLTYNKKYKRALRKARVRAYTKLEAAADLADVLEELIEISEDLRRPTPLPVPDEPVQTPPAAGAESATPPDPAAAPSEAAGTEVVVPSLSEEAKQAEAKKKLEEQLTQLQAEAVKLAQEALLELSRPNLTQGQIDSYNKLKSLLGKWGYKLPDLP